MPLKDFLAILRRRWILITALTLICLAVAAGVSFSETPTYEASAKVYFRLAVGSTPGEINSGQTYTQNQINTYAAMTDTPLVLDPVASEIGHGYTAKSLAGKVAASAGADTVIVTITATDESATRAADIANATAASLGKAARSLATKDGNGQPTIDAQTVARATAPSSPSAPRKTRNMALGLLGGLFLGIALAVMRELLDKRLRNRSDVEAVSDAPLLGEVQSDRTLARRHIVVSEDAGGGVSAESFRRVQTNLDFLGVDEGPMAVVVTSAVAQEGKSSVAINVAIAAAEAGKRTLLVDADLRSPSVAEYLGVPGAAGLSSILAKRARLEDVVQPYGDDLPLEILASGPTPPDTLRLLRSEAMTALLSELSGRYDLVVLDCAPLLPVIDAAVLARQVSGAILVVRLAPRGLRLGGRPTASRGQLADAVRSLEQADADVLGVVLNGVPSKSDAYYGYGAGDKGAHREDDQTPATSSRGGSASGRAGVVGNDVPASRHGASAGGSAPAKR